MLIDLDFTDKYSDLGSNINLQLDTSNGGLIASFEHGGQRHKLSMAYRERAGIYWSHNFHITINQFTKWDEDPEYERNRLIWKNLDDAKSPEEKESARNKLFELVSLSEYGVSDNLDQALEYGKKFIESDEPYVMSISWVTQEHDGGWRWHKWGPYVGTHEARGEYLSDTPEIERVMIFHYYKLKPKDPVDK